MNEAAATGRRGPARLRSAGGWPLLAILALAGFNFLWQLGSSNFYIDEVFSVEHSVGPLDQVISQVSHTEVTPWPYFIALHEWLGRVGMQPEWVVRLPSAVAGIALVAAVYWAARTLVGRHAALIAATLCAVSPLVLQYAQQARVYIFVTLAGTVAVAATVDGLKRRPQDLRLLGLGGLCAVLALWLHYSAVFVIFPLCLWVAMQRGASRRTRLVYVGCCAAAEVLSLPLLVFQRAHAFAGRFPWGTAAKVLSIVETPFDGRVGENSVDLLKLLGVALVMMSLGILAVRIRRRDFGAERYLLVALAISAPLGILVLGALGNDVMISRYSSVAAPFLLIAIAASVSSLPRAGAAALATAAALIALAGLVRSHQTTGFYPPTKPAATWLRAVAAPSDAIVFAGGQHNGAPDVEVPFSFYLYKRPVAVPPSRVGSQPSLLFASIREHRRIWVVNELGFGSYPLNRFRRYVNGLLRPYQYRVASLRGFRTTTTITVLSLEPVNRAHRRT